MYQIDVEMRRDVNASNNSFDLPETTVFFDAGTAGLVAHHAGG